MNTDSSVFSKEFQQLYCATSVFENFSVLHPVSLSRVLPFQAQDAIVEVPQLLAAESAHLASPGIATRLAVVTAFGQCGLLPELEVASLKEVIDFFDADFFELMGEVYANAGMYICALRWYREFIAELESARPNLASDSEGVYASVGYCLYSLGLHPEAVLWSRSCIGPRQVADTVFRALINYEARLQGGCIQCVERSANRTRYTVSALASDHVGQLTPRLLEGMKLSVPFQDNYIDWVSAEAQVPEVQAEGYPFQAELDAGALTRHRMNLLFALCGQADALAGRGYSAEAKRLLCEAALLEPRAEFVQERLKALP